MATIEEVNGRLSAIVEDGFAHFTNELNAFHANPAPDTNVIATFLNRTQQYSMLFWGYDHITRSLGISDANQSNRTSQIRSIVDGQIQQLQNLLNQYQTRQTQYTHQPPSAGQNAIQDAERYRQQVMAEVMAKRQQMFAYTNRLRELTQGGVPYIQAELIAKQETGYHS